MMHNLLFSILAVLVLISIVPTVLSDSHHGENIVPNWVKNTAGWWATDAISEMEFVNAIEFLIKNGIIKVDYTCIYEVNRVFKYTDQKIIQQLCNNEYNLDSLDESDLAMQANWLDENPSKYILIEGHCDERGTREYNLALGERRANATRDYLISMGISPDRISTVTFGKERPDIEGSYEDAWQLNRRSVTTLDVDRN